MDEPIKDPGETSTDRLCAVCSKSRIIERRFKTYDPSAGPMIFGPGSKHQFTEAVEYYCPICGVSYHHLPEL